MLTGRRTYLWTSGKGRKLRVDVISSPQSNMMVVDLNLSTLHGKVGCPDRQYWKKNMRMSYLLGTLPTEWTPQKNLILKHIVSCIPEQNLISYESVSHSCVCSLRFPHVSVLRGRLSSDKFFRSQGLRGWHRSSLQFRRHVESLF